MRCLEDSKVRIEARLANKSDTSYSGDDGVISKWFIRAESTVKECMV